MEYSTLIGSTNPDLGTAGLRLDDGVEIRAGAEWVFARSSPVIGVRLGVWRNPKHTTEYAGPSVYRRSLLPPGNNHVHLAAGVGVAFERFKVDLAVDFSPLVDTVSLSSIYSF